MNEYNGNESNNKEKYSSYNNELYVWTTERDYNITIKPWRTTYLCCGYFIKHECLKYYYFW